MPFAKMTVYVAKAINKQAIQDSIRGCGARLTWTLPEPQGMHCLLEHVPGCFLKAQCEHHGDN